MQRPTETPRDRFTRLLTASESEIALDEAALLIAAEEYEGLDVGAYLASLDALAASAGERLVGAKTDPDRVERLNRFLFVDERFSGNRGNYYDPRNSYLNEVIDRRSGIPITLSVVYIAVAKRLGLEVCGIGFPGHFLLKWIGEDEIIIDAFAGATVSLDECQERLTAAMGSPHTLQPELHLRPAGAREILVRMLGNLKQIFVQRGDWNRALDCCERTLLIFPDSPPELRDRGLILEQLDCFYAAAADLDRFLELAPNDPSSEGVRARREALTHRLGRLH